VSLFEALVNNNSDVPSRTVRQVVLDSTIISIRKIQRLVPRDLFQGFREEFFRRSVRCSYT